MINVCDIQVMKPLLAEHGFHFSKAKGQNFLIQRWVPERIAEDSGVDETVGVLEIGPGIGPLTQQLCLRAKKVCAVELDTRLKPILDLTVGEFDNLEIVWDDVLKQDIKALVAEKFDGLKPMACANLPYYITSPIVMMLLESKLPIDSITVMVQKEAAERLCAEVGSRDAGAVTVAVSYYAEKEILFEVGRDSFMPSPNVDSAVIRLKVLKEPPIKVKDEKRFFSLAKACFAQRRKTLVNTVSNTLEINKDTLRSALKEIGLSETVRGEQLNLEQLARLSDFI